MTKLARSSQAPAVDVALSPAQDLHEPHERERQFRALFQSELPYVWTSLRRLGVPARDLEDVTHDVLLEVYKNFDRYDPTRPLRPWLFAFAFRFASDYR